MGSRWKRGRKHFETEACFEGQGMIKVLVGKSSGLMWHWHCRRCPGPFQRALRVDPGCAWKSDCN